MKWYENNFYAILTYSKHFVIIVIKKTSMETFMLIVITGMILGSLIMINNFGKKYISNQNEIIGGIQILNENAERYADWLEFVKYNYVTIGE